MFTKQFWSFTNLNLTFIIGAIILVMCWRTFGFLKCRCGMANSLILKRY